jgi:nitrogen fixation-related uncharacterized protein
MQRATLRNVGALRSTLSFDRYNIKWEDADYIARDAKVDIWSMVQKAHFNSMNPPPSFDGYSMIISKKKLPFEESMVYPIASNSSNRINIKHTSTLTMQDLHKYFQGNNSDKRNQASPQVSTIRETNTIIYIVVGSMEVFPTLVIILWALTTSQFKDDVNISSKKIILKNCCSKSFQIE